MSMVTVGRGSAYLQSLYVTRYTGVIIDVEVLKRELNIKDAKLILSIRDSIMIKSLRSGRNVFLVGDHSALEQVERIDEVLNAQSQIDLKEYKWKVRDF